MTTLRWISRILGLLLVGLFAVFAIGQGFNPFQLGGSEIALMSVLLVALSGMLVAWRRELLGGVMVIAGMVAFYSINFGVSGHWPGQWVFPLCFVPGILAILSWGSARARSSHRLSAR